MKDVEALLDRGLAPDLDSQFRTPEELAERLSILLRPVPPKGARDLAQVSRDAGAKLRKANRATRLAELGGKLVQVVNQARGVAVNCFQELDPVFSPSVGGPVNLPMPPGIDQIPHVADLCFLISAKGTRATYTVIVRVGADRDQGVVLRIISPLTQGTVKPNQQWEKLLWFVPEQVPAPEDLARLVRDGLAHAIEELVEATAQD